VFAWCENKHPCVLLTRHLWENSLRELRRPRCPLCPASALQKFSMKCTKGILFIHKKTVCLFKVSPLRKFLFCFSSCGIQLSTFLWLGDKKDQTHMMPTLRFFEECNMCGFCCRMVELIISRNKHQFWNYWEEYK
jgi:hypothetical protein